jgi:hypothetical protein
VFTNNVDKIVASLLKMVEKLEKHHAERLGSMEDINKRMAALRLEHQDHAMEAGRPMKPRRGMVDSPA